MELICWSEERGRQRGKGSPRSSRRAFVIRVGVEGVRPPEAVGQLHAAGKAASTHSLGAVRSDPGVFKVDGKRSTGR